MSLKLDTFTYVQFNNDLFDRISGIENKRNLIKLNHDESNLVEHLGLLVRNMMNFKLDRSTSSISKDILEKSPTFTSVTSNRDSWLLWFFESDKSVLAYHNRNELINNLKRKERFHCSTIFILNSERGKRTARKM